MIATLSPIRRARTEPKTKLRVLVVDDSVVMRRMLSRMLTEDPLFEVLGSARDGMDALAKLEALRPDVVTLDVEMPHLDGMETLKVIHERFPEIKVIMLSSLTARGAAISIDALMHGASDYIAKPDGTVLTPNAYEDLSTELKLKIRQLFDIAGQPPPPSAPIRNLAPPSSKPVRLAPQILVIGVSTGGPPALAELMPMFPADFPLPIAIVQHMPPTFTRLLAERLNKFANIEVLEATHDMKLRPGLAVVAPGNFHMRLVRRFGGIQVSLNQEEHENSCRPAVDVLFRSAAELFGGAAIAAILTGMGRDGLLGAQEMKKLGAPVLAQDRATSVVWGMPGAVVEAGLADAILPLNQIVPEVINLLWPR